MNRRWFLQVSAFLPFLGLGRKQEQPTIRRVVVEAWSESAFNWSRLDIPGFLACSVEKGERKEFDLKMASGQTAEEAIESFRTQYSAFVDSHTVFDVRQPKPVLSPLELVHQELEHWKGKTWEQIEERYRTERAAWKMPSNAPRHYRDDYFGFPIFRDCVLMRVGLSHEQYCLSFGVNGPRSGSRLHEEFVITELTNPVLYENIPESLVLVHRNGSWKTVV